MFYKMQTILLPGGLEYENFVTKAGICMSVLSLRTSLAYQEDCDLKMHKEKQKEHDLLLLQMSFLPLWNCNCNCFASYVFSTQICFTEDASCVQISKYQIHKI